jgi:hypothetical protein
MYFKYHSSIKSGHPFFIVCLVLFILFFPLRCFVDFFFLLLHYFSRGYEGDCQLDEKFIDTSCTLQVYNHLKLSIFMEIIFAMHKIKWNVFLFLLLFRTRRNFLDRSNCWLLSYWLLWSWWMFWEGFWCDWLCFLIWNLKIILKTASWYMLSFQ